MLTVNINECTPSSVLGSFLPDLSWITINVEEEAAAVQAAADAGVVVINEPQFFSHHQNKVKMDPPWHRPSKRCQEFFSSSSARLAEHLIYSNSERTRGWGTIGARKAKTYNT